MLVVSGETDEFEGGAHRDSSAGKPRFDLIPPQPLKRLAEIYRHGAETYGQMGEDGNWTRGMPTSRCWASLERHVIAYKAGERDEDHLAQIVWNAFTIMFFEGTDWHDMPDWTPGDRPDEFLEELIRHMAQPIEDTPPLELPEVSGVTVLATPEEMAYVTVNDAADVPEGNHPTEPPDRDHFVSPTSPEES